MKIEKIIEIKPYHYSIMYGTLLGDGYMALSGYIGIRQSSQKIDYVLWLYNALFEYTTQKGIRVYY